MQGEFVLASMCSLPEFVLHYRGPPQSLGLHRTMDPSGWFQEHVGVRGTVRGLRMEAKSLRPSHLILPWHGGRFMTAEACRRPAILVGLYTSPLAAAPLRTRNALDCSYQPAFITKPDLPAAA